MFRFITILILSLSFCKNTSAQGIPFMQASWDEVVQKAKKEKKLIFVDAYASWCGPCKRMDQLTFTHQAVTKFFSNRFISFKIDMEKGEGPQLNSLFKVTAFPTLLFITPEEEIVHKITGFQEANKLMDQAEIALEKYNPAKELEDSYKNGNRDEDFILEYVKTLDSAGKPTKDIVNSYFKGKQLTDISGKEAQILFYGLQESDSRYFEALTDYLPLLKTFISESKVEEKIEKVCMATVVKSFEYQYDVLLEEAKTHYGSIYPEKAIWFNKRADLNYSLLQKDRESVNKGVMALADVEYADNAAELIKLNRVISNAFGKNAHDMTKLRILLLSRAIDIDENAETYIELAQALFSGGEKEKAVEQLEKALELSLEGDENRQKAEKMIQSIKSL